MSYKIAVLSDIHGNMRALDAVLVDIKHRCVDQVINLGDCAYGPFNPIPVLDRLIESTIPTVSGNEDQILVDPLLADGLSQTARFTQSFLTQRHAEWLAALPLRIEREDLIAFHAQPNDRAAYLLIRPTADGGVRPATQDEFADLLSDVLQPLILCGHDHLPRSLILADGRMIVNPGSVGCPAYDDDAPIPHRVANGTPHARYTVVEIRDGVIRVEPIRVVYDWNAAADEVAANGFPNWALWIATGRS
ncbi:metallophosphatase family protein [Candidatus Bipolaricaulota bacterium]|nr:metallophosphatase family protein [Candidatus Bipolaricaulota bacterium]